MRKQVYPNYRIDKNISWYNLTTWPMGIIYGLISLEWIREPKTFVSRLKPWKFWLPPVWVDYSEEKSK